MNFEHGIRQRIAAGLATKFVDCRDAPAKARQAVCRIINTTDQCRGISAVHRAFHIEDRLGNQNRDQD